MPLRPPALATPRYTFANQLRGIAALCVALNHLTGLYWVAPQLAAAATFTAAVGGPIPAFARLTVGPWYNLGPFGVALFFLISGFVIPISLERQPAAAFLIGRVFRIYPTYLIAFGIELAVVALNAHFSGRPFDYDAKTLLANALLVTDIANTPNIDLVSWTLTVEWKFYLLVAAFAPLVRRGNLTVIFALALTILGVSRFSHEIFVLIPALGRLLRIFESNALYVLFMLIGVVFSYHVRGRVGNAAAAGTIVVLFAMFVACWPLTFFRGEYPSATYNYGWALLVFSGAYLFRRAVPDWRVADFFAAISYPLYLVHTLIGFSALTLLVSHGVNAPAATLAALAAVIALAFGLHVAVERRSQTFGKAVAAALVSLPAPAEG